MTSCGRFMKLFGKPTGNVIGMIHVPALPGTPRQSQSTRQILQVVANETEIYKQFDQIDGLIIENMHDLPYVKAHRIGPEIVSAMTVVAAEVRRVWSPSKPLGIQVLAGANEAAVAIAHAVGLDFIRAEGFVFGHVADEGYIDACAGPLLRYRKMIGAENLAVFCDIKKKHSAHAITSDVDIVETANAAKFFDADGVIVTGTATGAEADPEEVKQIQSKVKDLPVLVGSGVTMDNVEAFAHAQALIIGSHFKVDGQWQNTLDPNRIERFCQKMKQQL